MLASVYPGNLLNHKWFITTSILDIQSFSKHLSAFQLFLNKVFKLKCKINFEICLVTINAGLIVIQRGTPFYSSVCNLFAIPTRITRKRRIYRVGLTRMYIHPLKFVTGVLTL